MPTYIGKAHNSTAKGNFSAPSTDSRKTRNQVSESNNPMNKITKPQVSETRNQHPRRSDAIGNGYSPTYGPNRGRDNAYSRIGPQREYENSPAIPAATPEPQDYSWETETDDTNVWRLDEKSINMNQNCSRYGLWTLEGDQGKEDIPEIYPREYLWKCPATKAADCKPGENLLSEDFPTLGTNGVTKKTEKLTCDAQITAKNVSAPTSQGSVRDEQKQAERKIVPECKVEEIGFLVPVGQNSETCPAADTEPFPLYFPKRVERVRKGRVATSTEPSKKAKPAPEAQTPLTVTSSQQSEQLLVKKEEDSALERQNAELKKQVEKLTEELLKTKAVHADAVQKGQETAQLLDSEIKEKTRIQTTLEQHREDARHIKDDLIKQQDCNGRHSLLINTLKEEVEQLKTQLRSQKTDQEKEAGELQGKVRQLSAAQTLAATNIGQLEASLSAESKRANEAERLLACLKTETSQMTAVAERAGEKFKEQQRLWQEEKVCLQRKEEQLAANLEAAVKQADETLQKERKDRSIVNTILLKTISDLKNTVKQETEERKLVTEKMLEKMQILEEQVEKAQKQKPKWKSFFHFFRRK